MAGETGEGPSPPGPTNSISWVGLGGTQYITKWALFTSLGLFFSNCNSSIGGFGPFDTLRDPFPRGPQGLVAPPPPSLDSFLQPWPRPPRRPRTRNDIETLETAFYCEGILVVRMSRCLTLARIRCFATFGRTGGMWRLVRPPPPLAFPKEAS